MQETSMWAATILLNLAKDRDCRILQRRRAASFVEQSLDDEGDYGVKRGTSYRLSKPWLNVGAKGCRND